VATDAGHPWRVGIERVAGEEYRERAAARPRLATVLRRRPRLACGHAAPGSLLVEEAGRHRHRGAAQPTDAALDGSRWCIGASSRLPLVPLELRDEPEKEGEILLALARSVRDGFGGCAHHGEQGSFNRAARTSTGPLARPPARNGRPSTGTVTISATCRLPGAFCRRERSLVGEGGAAEPPADQAPWRSLVPTGRARPAQGIEAQGPPRAQVAGRVRGGHEDVADPDPTGAPRARDHGHVQSIGRAGRVRRLPYSPFVPARTSRRGGQFGRAGLRTTLHRSARPAAPGDAGVTGGAGEIGPVTHPPTRRPPSRSRLGRPQEPTGRA